MHTHTDGQTNRKFNASVSIYWMDGGIRTYIINQKAVVKTKILGKKQKTCLYASNKKNV